MNETEDIQSYKKQATLPPLHYQSHMNSHKNTSMTEFYENSSFATPNSTFKSIPLQLHSPQTTNVNLKIAKLFFSSVSDNNTDDMLSDNICINDTSVDNEALIADRLKNAVIINESDIHTLNDAQMKQKQLEFEEFLLEYGSDDENNENENENETVPDFEKLYPNFEERSAKIDEYLGQKPEPMHAIPADMLILPVYGNIKLYAKMLHVRQSVIKATLQKFGIYGHTIITQEAGEQLVQRLRPNIEIILETWIDEIRSRLPYNKSSDDYKQLRKRKPVLCILGHVDHGKTTLLDKLRHTHVADDEAGGITQSIGAFSVGLDTNVVSHCNEIIVYDTPGHAAFTGMRQRGGQVVDVIILVIAADSGIQPQTKESLAIIRRENLPFVVALNKCDRSEADPDGVRKQLSELDVHPFEVEIIEISAKTGEGIDELLTAVDIVCELEDIRADFEKHAEVVVIEAKKSAAEGTVVNALVQDGCLRNGDILMQLFTDEYCKVTRLQNENNELIEKAEPSTPVTFLGFKHLPLVGSVLIAVENERQMHEILQMREKRKYFEHKLKHYNKVSVTHSKLYNPTAAITTQPALQIIDEAEDELSLKAKWSHVDDPQCLNVWIRADTWGSIEAIENYLYQIQIPDKEYYFKIIDKDVGPLYENIIRSADERSCFMLAFNVPQIKCEYKFNKVTVIEHAVIFSMFEKLIIAVEQRLKPKERHKLCGRAVVKEIFNVKAKMLSDDDNASVKRSKSVVSKKETVIAGCVVDTGVIKVNGHFRVLRNSNIIYEQWSASELKHFAVNATEIEAGDECGLRLEFNDWEHEDIIECLDIVHEKQKIEPPIFELDLSLQQSLYGNRRDDYGNIYSSASFKEGDTIFSYDDFEVDDDEKSNDEQFCMSTNKTLSSAPRVKVHKSLRGKVTFEQM